MGRVTSKNLFVVFFLFSMDLSAEPYIQTLTVFVEGAKTNAGKTNAGAIIASLFLSADSFLKEPVLTQVMPANDAGEAKFVFRQLKYGKYAVGVFYDEDGDGKLNTGFLGIPSELVGVSNNAKGFFGPPSFHKASFEFPEFETISIILGRAME
jgi:uncharacterized protein (DUF2141 family)